MDISKVTKIVTVATLSLGMALSSGISTYAATKGPNKQFRNMF